MKYETPQYEVVQFLRQDVITNSQIGSESSGSGENIGGDGTQPWE